MIEAGNGLDLDWKETRKSLNIPVKDDKKAYRYINRHSDGCKRIGFS